MQINHQLNEILVGNQKLFNESFFQRFSQRKYWVKLSDEVYKNYSFPTFYKDIRFSTIAFLCSYRKAQELMPHSKIKPVRMPGGKTLLVFSCYEYNTVNEIEPYNEVGFLIPVMANSVVNLPVIPLLLGNYFKRFGYHVICMPVTSLESKIRGDEIWGLPKQVNEINYEATDSVFSCSIKEETGEDVVKLRIPMNGYPVHLDETTYLYTQKNHKILKSQTWFEGDFMMNKYTNQLLKPTKPDKEFITIGDSKTGKLLKSLEIESHPFQTRYSHNLTSAFDLPAMDYQI